MVYIFLGLRIYNGDVECSSETVHEIPSGMNINDFAEKYASDFYPNPDERDGESENYTFQGGTISVGIGHVTEIPQSDYEVLRKYL